MKAANDMDWGPHGPEQEHHPGAGIHLPAPDRACHRAAHPGDRGLYRRQGRREHLVGIPDRHAARRHARGRHPAGHHRHALPDAGDSRVFHPAGAGGRHLPFRVCQRQRLDAHAAHGHHQPGGRAIGGLRPVRAGIVRAVLQIRHQHPFRFADAFHHDPAGDHQHHRRSHAQRALPVPHRGHLAGRHAVADHPQADPAPGSCRGS